jgi:hypothetical protein
MKALLAGIAFVIAMVLATQASAALSDSQCPRDPRAGPTLGIGETANACSRSISSRDKRIQSR